MTDGGYDPFQDPRVSLVTIVGMSKYARGLPPGLLPYGLVCDDCGAPSRPLWLFTPGPADPPTQTKRLLCTTHIPPLYGDAPWARG